MSLNLHLNSSNALLSWNKLRNSIDLQTDVLIEYFQTIFIFFVFRRIRHHLLINATVPLIWESLNAQLYYKCLLKLIVLQFKIT